MGLYKRGKVWWIDFYWNGERKREAVGPNKNDAETVLGQRRADILQGRNPVLRRVRLVLFKDHAKEVLEQHYSKKRCEEWARLVVEKHLSPFFGKTLLGDINTKMVTHYMTRRIEGGVANSTVNHERAVLSKVMNLAVEWELIHENPVRRVKKLEQCNGRLRFLSHDEADLLITNAAKHLKPVIVTALETGGRLSEILGLQWEDVDLDRGILHFDQTNTKNAKAREIPLTPLLAATLKERSKVRAIGGDARNYVFTRYGKRLQDVRTGFVKARGKIGLGKDVTFHTLRHTFASWYAMRPGSDLNLLRELLGHQDLKTTMIYAHLSPDYKRSALPLMGRQPVSVQLAADTNWSQIPASTEKTKRQVI